MSLKAKIEAVIYAAEEPVTLAQLAAIFAAEVPSPEKETLDTAPVVAQQMEAIFAEPLADPEITVIDQSGTMSDFFTEVAPSHHGSQQAAHAAALDTAPLVAEPVGVSEPRDTHTTQDESGAPEARLFESENGSFGPVEIKPPATQAEGLSQDQHPSEGPPDVKTAVDPEAAAKRLARQRDREIRDHIRTLVDELIADYVVGDRGIEIREIAGGYRMATKPEYHDAVRAFVKSLKPVMKLSLQALETLAVIAYKQPVTAPEVAEIRGVDAGGILASLISRKLVTTAGRKQVIGRPILYKTTKEFLLRFGLKDVAELPSMEEFETMAVELAESDAIEAQAMHEKAGVDPAAEHEGSEPLPFEHANRDSSAPPDEIMESSSTANASTEASSRPEPGGVEATDTPASPTAPTNEIEAVPEDTPQEQES